MITSIIPLLYTFLEISELITYHGYHEKNTIGQSFILKRCGTRSMVSWQYQRSAFIISTVILSLKITPIRKQTPYI